MRRGRCSVGPAVDVENPFAAGVACEGDLLASVTVHDAAPPSTDAQASAVGPPGGYSTTGHQQQQGKSAHVPSEVTADAENLEGIRDAQGTAVGGSDTTQPPSVRAVRVLCDDDGDDQSCAAADGQTETCTAMHSMKRPRVSSAEPPPRQALGGGPSQSEPPPARVTMPSVETAGATPRWLAELRKRPSVTLVDVLGSVFGNAAFLPGLLAAWGVGSELTWCTPMSYAPCPYGVA